MAKLISYFILVLIFSYCFFLDSNAQISSELSKIQTPGIINLRANNPSNNESVNWIASSYYIDENTNQLQVSTDTLFEIGDSIRVLLTKKVGKYTFYKIKAFNNSFVDSITFQVLNKGVPTKYLFQNKSLPTKPILVYVVLPNDIMNADFIVIMHGVNRNSLDYIQAWKDFCVNNNYVGIAPTFSDEDWPSSISYNLGNMFINSSGTGLIKPDSIWSFTQISKIHEELAEGLGLINPNYDIWGHSAGAQFVHRLMTFKPDYKIRYAISANAGWYTLPDLDIEYPYGLKNDNFSFEETFLEDLVLNKLIIMRGEEDTIRDSNLRTSPEADAQGLNRFERAFTYYNYANQIASINKWELIDVPNVGHDYQLMALAAQDYLLKVTNIKMAQHKSVNQIRLSQNYPNPFNPNTNIEYQLPFGGHVKIKIYNMLGEELVEILNGYKNAGIHSVQFNANEFPSGVYLYKISTEKYTHTKKMLLLK